MSCRSIESYCQQSWQIPIRRIAAHEKGEPGAAEADTLRAYLRQIGRVPLLTTQEERQLCEQIETARVALAAALLAAPSPRHRISALEKEVLGWRGGVRMSCSKPPTVVQLHSQEITDAAHLLAVACRERRGARAHRPRAREQRDPRAAAGAPTRSGRDSHVCRPHAFRDTCSGALSSSRSLLTPSSLPPMNAVVVFRCDSRHCSTSREG